MKHEEKIKTYKGYFESIGMDVCYADEVIACKRMDDGGFARVETGTIYFGVEYENSYYKYLDKKWHKDTCRLTIDILPNGWWSINAESDDNGSVNLGSYTEEVAKAILENLVKCK